MLNEGLLFQLFRLQVVEGQGNLLVFVVLIIVVQFEVGFLLGCHHPPHQLHGRVVTTAIAVTF